MTKSGFENEKFKTMNRADRRMVMRKRHSNYYTKKYKSSNAKEYARSILNGWK